MDLKKVRIVSIIISLVLIIGICTSCVNEKDKNEISNQEGTTHTTTETVISSVEQQIQDEEEYEIETDYCSLYYPVKWKDSVDIENSEDERNVIEFYGKVEGKERQKIFDIIFNADADIMIGSIESENQTIYVGFNFAEMDLDGWSKDEANIIYAMQEDVNYIIGMLKKEEGFKPAS